MPEGCIALTLLNVYSSLILRAGGAVLLFDPVKLNRGKLDLSDTDVMVITHEHLDHLDEELALEIQRLSGAPILTTGFVARRIERLGGKAQGFGCGESIELKGFKIHTEDCVHPANEPLSFIVQTQNLTIFHPADSVAFPGMEQIGTRYHPDIMLYFSTSKDDLISITDLVKPRLVVTYHSSRFADLHFSDTRIKLLRQRETFIYPSEC